jgi:hypothetical protein
VNSAKNLFFLLMRLLRSKSMLPATPSALTLSALIWLILCFRPPSARAQIPPLIVPQGVGVNIHFTSQRQHDLDLIAAAGFKFIRMDFTWAAIETTRGQYDFSDYDQLVSDLQARGLRAIFILDYSNPLYEGQVAGHRAVGEPVAEMDTASPRHPESIAAFARWAAAAAVHFKKDHVIWEIFNEPNGNFWKPAPNAQEYSALAVATAQAIRQAQPDATIVGPALAGMDWKFLDVFLASGVLTNLDAVSVHPYREPTQPPETAGPDYARIRQRIDHFAPPAKRGKIPILSGEWGYSSSRGGVSLSTQAQYAVRQQLFNLSEGIPISIWYDWKNDGHDPDDGEQNFGTVTETLEPKPAYRAIQEMIKTLSGAKLAMREQTTDNDPHDFILLFGGSSPRIAAWTIAAPHRALGPNALELQLTATPLYDILKPKP